MLLHKKESIQSQRYQISSNIKIAAVQGSIKESIKIPAEKVLESFHRKISHPKPTLVSLGTIHILRKHLTKQNLIGLASFSQKLVFFVKTK